MVGKKIHNLWYLNKAKKACLGMINPANNPPRKQQKQQNSELFEYFIIHVFTRFLVFSDPLWFCVMPLCDPRENGVRRAECAIFLPRN